MKPQNTESKWNPEDREAGSWILKEAFVAILGGGAYALGLPNVIGDVLFVALGVMVIVGFSLF